MVRIAYSYLKINWSSVQNINIHDNFFFAEALVLWLVRLFLLDLDLVVVAGTELGSVDAEGIVDSFFEVEGPGSGMAF